MTYKEARVYLDKVSKYGSVLGLDTIRELLHELGDPQKDLKFIHIAGTNGKGSVLAYTSTILSEAGYKVGKYVSPTVISYLERIQVNGQWISEDAFARLTKKIQEAIARMAAAGKGSPTVFEAETAIAFLYYKEQNCDFVVLECGLGGSLDATNIIDNTTCAVFTSISLDHLGVIGNTLEEIAENKAGIIKPGCTVISAPQSPQVKNILTKRAQSLECPIYFADKKHTNIIKENYDGQTFTYKDDMVFNCPLAGKFQITNAITTLEIMHVLPLIGYPVPKEAIQNGLKKTVWPGRFTCVYNQPLFFIDGAHNEAAAQSLRESIETYFPGKRPIYIMGVFKDKEYEKIAAIMAPLSKAIHTVTLPDKGRSLPADILTKTVRKYAASDVDIRTEQSIETAVKNVLEEAQENDIIVAFGSLSYLEQISEVVRALLNCNNTVIKVKK